MYSKRALRCVTQHLSENVRSSQIQCCTSSPAARIAAIDALPSILVLQFEDNCRTFEDNRLSHDEQVSIPCSTVQDRSPHISGKYGRPL